MKSLIILKNLLRLKMESMILRIFDLPADLFLRKSPSNRIYVDGLYKIPNQVRNDGLGDLVNNGITLYTKG